MHKLALASEKGAAVEALQGSTLTGGALKLVGKLGPYALFAGTLTDVMIHQICFAEVYPEAVYAIENKILSTAESLSTTVAP
jgi:hypothetical protein